MKSKHYFNPKDGKLNLENRKGFQNRVKLLKEKRHVMTIEEDTLTRSEKQNRYYFGVVCLVMGKHTGYSKDEIHQLMGKEFLKYESKGEIFILSTTKLSTKKMEQYLDKVRLFAIEELDCRVPLPNESNLPYDIYA